MVRKFFLVPVFAVAFASLLFFAACGDEEDDETATSTATSAAGSSAGPSSASPTATVPADAGSAEIINVSYDPTRELYAQYADLFADHYRRTTGVSVSVENSHGGSGSQARAIVDGLEADVATLALAGDTSILEQRRLIEPGWESEFPNNSNPYVSTIVLLVRKGNPKGIHEWADLAKPDVGVITPNPKTSGGARWNFLAAWGSVSLTGGTEDQARELVSGLYENVLVLDSGARASTQTFVDRNIGDVLIAWENEALLSTRDSDEFEIVYPSESIIAEPSVAVVDANVDRKDTREVATEFLNYLYSKEAQKLIAENFYRPSDPEVLAEYQDQYPEFDTEFTIRDFGGWSAVAQKFFAEGAIFDQIYTP